MTITKLPRCHVRSSRFMTIHFITISKFTSCFLLFLKTPPPLLYQKCLVIHIDILVLIDMLIDIDMLVLIDMLMLQTAIISGSFKMCQLKEE